MEILDRNEKLPEGRMRLIEVAMLLGFLGLGLGLWQLQILQAAKYSTLAAQNRIRTEPIPAPRGRIYDRRGRLLVDNYPSFTAYLTRDSNPAWRADLPQIAKGLFLPLADLGAQVQRFQSAPVYQPIPIKADITATDQAFIAAHRDQFPELETIM
ncbi:MAG: hypothetical protein ACRDOE_13065, partial [Streptosporangiaceae bacterium]